MPIRRIHSQVRVMDRRKRIPVNSPAARTSMECPSCCMLLRCDSHHTACRACDIEIDIGVAHSYAIFRYSDWGSNPDWDDFKSSASADWATGACTPKPSDLLGCAG